MLAALLLLGLLPLATLPLMQGDGAGDAELPEDDETPADGSVDVAPLDDLLGGGGHGGADGQTYGLSAEPGLVEVADFSPGVDILEYDLSGVGGDIHFEFYEGEDGVAFAVTTGPEDVAEIRFPGLTEVPVDDIFLKLADETGTVYEVSLAEAAAEAGEGAPGVLDPVPPNTPDEPGPVETGDPLDPLPPDAPDPPGPAGTGEPLDPLPPDIPDVPGGAGDPLDPLSPDAPDPPGPGGAGDALDPLQGGMTDASVADGTPPVMLEVDGFTVGEDLLRLTLPAEDGFGDTAEVSVAPSGDGADGLVTVNGQLVAVLRGAPDVSVSDVFAETRPAAIL